MEFAKFNLNIVVDGVQRKLGQEIPVSEIHAGTLPNLLRLNQIEVFKKEEEPKPQAKK